ncbi:DUF4175 family protein [Lutibacter sp. TH_r2]|uniref:DUF4175 family protein n=1 Tax=Lutibacter sp. TH_r2 TaxID=3082083 RepID=UPI0029556ECF|nr:DUF4175 family protein [Lutibacter sp. TH_r2]MDV7186566.1 DUF4175 family protein [Lutibacter sp. TH_r2]
MSSIHLIKQKLQQFIRKYYVNQLIKGTILFVSIGLLYFIFTLIIEHFLWLKPTLRTILFWIFILVEVLLLVIYVAIPIIKLIGFKRGISEVEASKLIGKYFPEVNDKLLNMLQLESTSQHSELIEASIEQKSKQLQPIPFVKAVNFSSNKKYLKYALLPLIIWLLVYVTGNINIFNDSLTRVVNHNTVYQPPAPFIYQIINKNLDVLEGNSITVQVKTIGNVVPNNAKIMFSGESYYLQNNGLGNFEYTFSNIKKSFVFYIEANNVVSQDFQINSIATPVITNLKMILNYPDYTGKNAEVIENTGNAIVPQGTQINWQVETHQTESISLKQGTEVSDFNKTTTNHFNFKKQILKPLNYTISTSNKQLKNHEQLNFSVDVVNDEFPKISVISNIDSISRGPIDFAGELTDDYLVSKLELVYYNKQNPSEKNRFNIDIKPNSFTNFYYIFPEGINIEEGVDYEMYFQVFDNDRVNGSKKTKSKVFSYYNKTETEVKEELLKEQSETISNISKALSKSKKENSDFKKLQEELQKKGEINWNDTQKLEQFLQRQNQYQQMLQKQTDKLQQNLDEQPKLEKLAKKKQDLEKRIEETKKLAEQEKLLKELEELTKKFDKDELQKKLKELTKKNKRNEQSLERILELTKRFYVEQKAAQIQEKLEKLAEEENKLSKNNEENTSEKQEEINKEFDKLKEEFKDLDKENKGLKRPMKLPKPDDEVEDIEKDLQDAMEQLQKEESEQNSESKSKASKSQKSAAKKMKQLASKMGESMEGMEGEEIDENIEDLRKILENLIEFSFQQEDLFNKFSNATNQHPEYSSNLKKQHVLKEYFEHIDDSLYALSLRLVKMGAQIQQDVNEVHFQIDESISNLSENLVDLGNSNQQFVITSTNDLANKLSDILQALMNASPSFGSGKSGKGKGFSLPDIIKKQGEVSEQMKKGMKSGKEKGKNGKPEEKGENGKPGGEGENGEQQEMSNGELFEIYKQQAELKQMLKDLLGESKGENGKRNGGDVVKKMEELEQEMLEKGFSSKVVDKMQKLSYELLKLEEAMQEQGKDEKRKSETNKQDFQQKNIKKLNLKKPYFNNTEILNRQSLPLRTIYKKKVQEYFKSE